ncbi:MAG: FMN-binding glutamate synthase family protein, partial [Deltaproteobacteria bacterium]|nr:FMN-binding glutamate synthase family protein [Deltaproteobacteria bacterium]
MEFEAVSQFVILAMFVVLLAMFLGPPLVFAVLYWLDRRQTQHAVLRNYPILGRFRYLLEHIGPELRQYLFNADLEGKPFTREGYLSIVFAGKYLNTLISLGSKRDFDKPGWYVRNAMLPTLIDDMAAIREPRIPTRRYVIHDEGLFSRKEDLVDADVAPWTLDDE